MRGGSTVALVAAMSATCAYAQQAPQSASGNGNQNSNLATVVVTAQRVSILGYESPTPVTVLSGAALSRDAEVDIGDELRQLPSVGASDALTNGSHAFDASQGDAAISDVNLRNLGVVRTLVLFDGQRVVASNPISGGVDLSTLPTDLVQRVEVVTGGASASWGSDAVAGVVDLILNKTFTGLKGNVEYGDNQTNTNGQYKADLTWGRDFGSRAHLELSGDYISSPDTMFNGQAPWFNMRSTLIPNPSGGSPEYVHMGNFGSSQYTPGGIIESGPLKGIQFVGSGASPVPFNYGTLPIVSGNCFDCSGNAFSNQSQWGLISVPYHRTTLFAYGSYRLTDNVMASLQLNYGDQVEDNTGLNRFSQVNIQSGNPFIPAAIQAQMTADGLSSIRVGTNNLGNLSPTDYNLSDLGNTIGWVYNQNERQLARFVFTLAGALGNNWSWNTYAEGSQVHENQVDFNDTLTANYNNAVDAVRVTSANAGTSGLPIGSIQCASTLIDPSNGCQPLDIFGTGNYSQAAMDYVAPGLIGGETDWASFNLSQLVFSGSMQGKLPWGFSAGDVATAFGVDYRKEMQRDGGNPLGAIGGWGAGNYSSWAGQYDVQEGFFELDAPILKNDFVKTLSAQVAGRITNYSTSGLVETWKLGLQSQVTDDIRLRGTYSQDIRAPILHELFAPAQLNAGAATNPITGIENAIFYTDQGNSMLQPEKARTLSFGVVLTPHQVPSLRMSVDYYRIDIHDAIFTPSMQEVLDSCTATVKIPIYCGDLFYGSGIVNGRATVETNGNGVVVPMVGLPADYNGALNYVEDIPQNAAEQVTSGIDFQADYLMNEFLGGSLNWHSLANYTFDNSRTALGLTYQGNGAVGADDPFATGPAFHGTLSATYIQALWSFTVQGRFIGPAVLNNLWQNGVQVDNNDVPSVSYLDLRTSYKLNSGIQLYAAVDNAANTAPPNIASTRGGSGPNGLYYDRLGRTYRLGLRFSF